MSGSVKAKIMAAKAKSTPKPKATKTFAVRQGTAAVCEECVGDAVAGRLFHALLELWVESKRKVLRRDDDGQHREFLFLSCDDLRTLSGLTEKQIYDRAIPLLKQSSFLKIARGRLTPDGPNQYQIRFDQDAFWAEIVAMLNPTKKVETKENGVIWVKQEVDREQLPYLFKRLYDAVTKQV